jgi:3-oxoacyl-[acyl-carrier-protein] synthase III
MYSKITGIGSYLPEKILSNLDLQKMVDTSDEWISERTGIKERRIAGENEATSDMALKAAMRACEVADVSPDSFDLILCATTTPDYILPGTSCILQKELKATNAAAFDLQAACSGFLYSLSVADSFIKSGQFRKVLVVGSDKLSSIVDYEDRETCVLFGDAAGAAIVEPSSKPYILSTHLGSMGHLWELLSVPNGGSRNPIRENNIGEKNHYIKMKGREIFKNAVNGLTTFALMALEKNNVSRDEIAYVVPHQANNRIIEAFAKRAEIPMDRFVVNLEKYGNTSSATIPVAMDEAFRDGRFKKDDLILTAAFGAGLTVASALIKWGV